MSEEITEVSDETSRSSAMYRLNKILNEPIFDCEQTALQIEVAKLILSATDYMSVIHYEVAAKRAAMADEEKQEPVSA